MTSDTKIGLLLGLVFIFVIAFLINGLPSFRSKTHGNDYTARMANLDSQQGLGVASPARQLQDRMAARTRLPETVERNPIFQNLQYAAPGPTNPVRGEWDFPEYLNKQLERDMQQKASYALSEVQGPSPAREEGQVVQRPVIHPVEENETLAAIAKRYYGQTEGNRQVNLDRIFEANSDKLHSPHQIRVGQRLVIPPLPGESLADVFIPVEKPHSTRLPRAAPTSQSPESYRVKEGDSLWKIAAKVLGNGSRYEDILKLNRDLLGSEESMLPVGAQLRLPTR